MSKSWPTMAELLGTCNMNFKKMEKKSKHMEAEFSNIRFEKEEMLEEKYSRKQILPNKQNLRYLILSKSNRFSQ